MGSTICFADGSPFKDVVPNKGQNKTPDTLFVHPKYPPLVYRYGEYRYFKYTAKYFPKSVLQSFKILATCGNNQLLLFRNRTEEEVIELGMFDSYCRMRKEFGLDGYSSFVMFFHDRGIYYPYSMKTYLLLSFHQCLNGNRIRWRKNKRVALTDRKALNKAWKKRLDHVFLPVILTEEPADIVDPVFLDPVEKEIYTY